MTGRTAVLLLALAPVPIVGQDTISPAAQRPKAEPASFGRAEYDWTLRDLEGQRFRLGRYRGRTLVLNVWATWCAPCVRELATLDRLAGSVVDLDVAFLLVSPERLDIVRAFLRRQGVTLPAAVEDQRMPASFGLEALPTTYIINRSGQIVLAHRGAADWDTDEVRALVRRLAR